jgi:hypothetical protein
MLILETIWQALQNWIRRDYLIVLKYIRHYYRLIEQNFKGKGTSG